MSETATETPLKTWLTANFDIYQPLVARRIANQFLRESHLPCDPQSVNQVMHNLNNLGLLMGSAANPKCRIRLLRKSK